jgi:hypothetical protein
MTPGRIVIRNGQLVVEVVCAFCGRWADVKNGVRIVSAMEIQCCCHRCALARGLLVYTSRRN